MDIVACRGMAPDNPTTFPEFRNSPRARVIRNLQEWIKDGRLVAGSRLPPEMHLAGRFNVSRSTIRMALADLSTQGVIEAGNRKWIVRDSINPSGIALSNCIAVIVGISDSPLDYSQVMHTAWHPIYVHTGAIEAIRRAGYDTFVAHPDSVKGDAIQRIVAQRPRGAIVLSRALQEESGDVLSQALRKANIPFVVYGDLSLAAQRSPTLSMIDSVISDHEAGSHALTKWLISQGRKRILRFWAFREERPKHPHFWLKQRDLGHERAMKEAGLAPLPPVEIYDASAPKFGYTKEIFDLSTFIAAGSLLKHLQGPEPIDAIMAVSDESIGQIAAALRLHGKEPNKDVLLVGYDNMWDDLEDVHRFETMGPVATVEKRNMEIGAQLMLLLQERIEGKLATQAEQRVVKPKIIIRPNPAAIPLETNAPDAL